MPDAKLPRFLQAVPYKVTDHGIGCYLIEHGDGDDDWARLVYSSNRVILGHRGETLIIEQRHLVPPETIEQAATRALKDILVEGKTLYQVLTRQQAEKTAEGPKR